VLLESIELRKLIVYGKNGKIISIRQERLHKLKAYSTNMDIPYQAYIKYLLNKGIKEDSPKKKKSCGVR
jgi:predicted DNA binding CopG/RHH family protein